MTNFKYRLKRIIIILVDILRYLIGVIIIIGGINGTINISQNYGIGILVGISLFPVIYRKLLPRIIDNRLFILLFQIFCPIILFVIYFISFFNTSVIDLIIDRKDIKTSTREVLENSLFDDQFITKFEEDDNNRYNVEIKFSRDDLDTYYCVVGFNNYISRVKYTPNLDSVKFYCTGSDMTNTVELNEIDSISGDYEEKVKIYDADNNLITTSLNELKQQSEDCYKKNSKEYSYKDVLRNPDEYKGKKAYWFGEVVQVVDKNYLGATYRVDVNCEKYSYSSGYYCDDTIYVLYLGDKNFIEDDIVKMWGTLDGIQSYTTVLGAQVTVPKFNAEYIELMN